MTTYELSHITDLRSLSPEDLQSFAQELPSFVATMRLVAAAAQARGRDIKDVLPSLTYAPDIGDAVVLRVDGQTRLVADGASVQVADATQQAISRARRRPS
jgi:hypothetical protein